MADSRTWGAPYKVGSYHYAEQFIRAGYDCCWITHPVSPYHWLSSTYKVYADDLRDKYRIWRNGGLRRGGLLQYSPLTLLPYAEYPLLRSDVVQRSMLQFTVPPLRAWLRKQDFADVDILWFANPALSGLADMVSTRHCVFRIADDNSAFSNIPAGIRHAEQRLIDRADTIFVTAPSLRERYPQARDKIFYLPNGVDFDFFNSAAAPLPEEYKSIPSPRIVYVGTIADWFDVETVLEAAKRLPDHAFVLIGESLIDLSVFRHRRNIHLLGGKRYELMPSYLQHADVGIIPFRNTKLVQSVNPIKLYEYMACGLPVVATRWKTLEDIASPSLLAGTAAEFADLVRIAAKGDADRNRRIAFARANSWKTRFEEALTLIKRSS